MLLRRIEVAFQRLVPDDDGCCAAIQSGIINQFLPIQCSSANKAIDGGSMMLTAPVPLPLACSIPSNTSWSSSPIVGICYGNVE